MIAEPDVNRLADPHHSTIDLIAAYVSNVNTRVTPAELQDLIRTTFQTLSALQHSRDEVFVETESANPSLPTRSDIRKSIGAERLVSFEDGGAYRSLTRHLSARGMSPDDYRKKWGLPLDYPMVHPTYSARRSQIAKAIGLGDQGRRSKPGLEAPAVGAKPGKLRARQTASR